MAWWPPLLDALDRDKSGEWWVATRVILDERWGKKYKADAAIATLLITKTET
jgi:hypothetical protein